MTTLAPVEGIAAMALFHAAVLAAGEAEGRKPYCSTRISKAQAVVEKSDAEATQSNKDQTKDMLPLAKSCCETLTRAPKLIAFFYGHRTCHAEVVALYYCNLYKESVCGTIDRTIYCCLSKGIITAHLAVFVTICSSRGGSIGHPAYAHHFAARRWRWPTLGPGRRCRSARCPRRSWLCRSNTTKSRRDT
jgi:hypothetical protein